MLHYNIANSDLPDSENWCNTSRDSRCLSVSTDHEEAQLSQRKAKVTNKSRNYSPLI